jgi:multisubunit Na+/H+ antiporter MnhG subunit
MMSDQPGPPPTRRTKRIYFAMMGTCLGLLIISWVVVSRYSTVAAVVMSVAALVIPPFAAIIANAASATDRRR